MGQCCASRGKQVFEVDSDSSDKTYTVTAFVEGEFPTCSCVAYAIQRNRNGGKNMGAPGMCKHIKRVLAETCTWKQKHGDPRIPRDGKCPECGGPVIDPEAQDTDSAKTVDGLLNILQDLKPKDRS